MKNRLMVITAHVLSILMIASILCSGWLALGPDDLNQVNAADYPDGILYGMDNIVAGMVDGFYGSYGTDETYTFQEL